MQTPSQTIGPFFAGCLIPLEAGYEFPVLVSNRYAGAGAGIEIRGSVLDGAGQVVDDALIEIWQADEQGQFSSGYSGFTRCGTGSGEFYFELTKPGIVAPGSTPHLNLTIFMRGLLNHLYTRLYFDDEDNQQDAILASIPASRKQTLIAVQIKPGEYRFDIHLQGDAETVFFDI